MFAKIWNSRRVALGNEKGTTIVEYALIVAGVAVALSALVFAFGGDITSVFKRAETPAAEEQATEKAQETAAPAATEETTPAAE